MSDVTTGTQGVLSKAWRECGACGARIRRKKDSPIDGTQRCANCTKAERASRSTICPVSGCSGKVETRGMCGLHSGRLYRTGTTDAPPPKSAPECIVDGCPNKPVARNWCNRHYVSWRSNGSPTAVDENKRAREEKLDGAPRACTKCGAVKSVDEFHRDAHSTTGYHSSCKPCRGGYMLGYYQENREQKLQYEAERRANNVEHIRNLDKLRYQRDKDKRIELATAHAQNRRARILGRDLDKGITVVRLRKLYGDRCPYCSCRLDFKVGKQGKYNKSRASIEHIIPISKGGTHTWDNVILACLGCNLARGNRAAPTHVQQPLGLDLMSEQEGAA